jgi:hypothetical protein
MCDATIFLSLDILFPGIEGPGRVFPCEKKQFFGWAVERARDGSFPAKFFRALFLGA